jgi:hypothetical protein
MTAMDRIATGNPSIAEYEAQTANLIRYLMVLLTHYRTRPETIDELIDRIDQRLNLRPR